MRRMVPVVGLFALLLFVGPSSAQESGVSGELEQSSTSTPREKSEFADGAVGEIQTAVSVVEDMLADAEREKNTEHIECLMRKLTPMRALLEVSKQSANAMKQALAANDSVHSEQEYRKVAVSLTKTREFLAEAQACVGDGRAEEGDTSNQMTATAENDVGTEDVPDGGVTEVGPPDTPR
jgi:hypothetical protein